MSELTVAYHVLSLNLAFSDVRENKLIQHCLVRWQQIERFHARQLSQGTALGIMAVKSSGVVLNQLEMEILGRLG